MTLGIKPLTSKAGEFYARCKLTSSAPERKMTPELWAVANAGDYVRAFRELTSERVDKETRRHGRWEIVFAACEGFETTDRQAYLEHMATLHGRKPGGPRQIKLGQRWHPPRLTEEGLPFVDRDRATETCERCGLVSERPSNHAAELWWREHLERCVGQQTAVA